MTKTSAMRCLRCGRSMPSSERGLAELCSRCIKEKAAQFRGQGRLNTIEEDRMDFLRRIIRK